MARKKPAKKARKKTAARAAGRKAARKTAKKAARKAVKRSARKAANKAAPASAKASASAKATADRSARKPKRKAVAGKAARKPKAAARSTAGASKKPNLDRPRKTVADIHGIPSSLGMSGGASAAASGRAELKDRIAKNTGAGPALTSGDVDADWESAEAVGDEAPGGDNPTPDQDVVDEIGRALGVEYEDDEELQGGAEITDRDKHRWELDPSSKDDFDEES